MKKIFLLPLFVFFLASGVIIGLAYERYFHREECLKLAFENNPESLSSEEIIQITQALNSENDVEETSNSPEQSNPDDNRNKGNDISPENSNNQSTPKNYIGSRNSNKFYPASCRYVKLIKEENKVYYGSVEEGERAGRKYVSCEN